MPRGKTFSHKCAIISLRQAAVFIITNCYLRSHTAAITGSPNKSGHIALITKFNASLHLKNGDLKRQRPFLNWMPRTVFPCVPHFTVLLSVLHSGAAPFTIYENMNQTRHF